MKYIELFIFFISITLCVLYQLSFTFDVQNNMMPTEYVVKLFNYLTKKYWTSVKVGTYIILHSNKSVPRRNINQIILIIKNKKKVLPTNLIKF